MENTGHSTIDVLVGVVFVLFHARFRFNTPPTNRSSTTAGRYFVALAMYCMIGVAAYLTLINFPHLLNFLAGGSTEPPGFAKELSNPLLVALLMTVLLPKLPLLSNLDQWIYKELQDMAAIPVEVRRLSMELRKQTPVVPPEFQEALGARLSADGFNREDLQFDSNRKPLAVWTKLTSLLMRVEDWETDRRMGGYLLEVGDVLTRIRARYKALIPKAKTCARLLRESAGADQADRMRDAANNYAADFSELAEELYNEVLDFISHGVLRAGMTDAARINRLTALGFSQRPERDLLTFNQLLSVFGAVGVLMLISFVLFSGEMTMGVTLVRVIMISVIFSAAVACAALPRERWGFAKMQEGGTRPVGFYIVAGLMAVGVSQLVGLVVNSALLRGLELGLQRSRYTYPWALMTFATSVVTAYLMDNQVRQGVSRLRWRLWEGLLGAIVMIGVAYVTQSWLVQISPVKETVDTLQCNVPPLLAVMVPAGAVGFYIGFLVPTWCREAPRGKQAKAVEAHPALSQV